MVRFNGAIPEWPVPGITDRSVKTECPLLAESGSQNLEYPAFLVSALPPKAAIRVVES